MIKANFDPELPRFLVWRDFSAHVSYSELKIKYMGKDSQVNSNGWKLNIVSYSGKIPTNTPAVKTICFLHVAYHNNLDNTIL